MWSQLTNWLIQFYNSLDSWQELAAFFGVMAIPLGALVATVRRSRGWYRHRVNQKRLIADFGSDFYPEIVLEQSTRYYVEPDSSNIDPAREAEIRHIVATKEDLFSVLDRSFGNDSAYRHMILLADSGMGKTSALLNYYVRNQKRQPGQQKRIAMVPLGIPDADTYITEIENKRETILFLDAFDEDTKAINDHKGRLGELMELCHEFDRIVITCRTQFFPSAEEIPTETGIVRVGPRSAGQGALYTFQKLYLMPLTDEQVEAYLRKRYSLWNYYQRRQAKRVVDKIPLLSVRPMLLAFIPDLLKSRTTIRYSYELYEELIEAWCQRESGWVEPEKLRHFSERLAVDLFMKRKKRGAERIPRAELLDLTNEWAIDLPDWQITGRSLLNHDAEGNLKFAHRSIMEYLFICCDVNGLDYEWTETEPTDQMVMFIAEIVENNQAHYLKNIPGANLAGLDLSSWELSHINLHGARFSLTTTWPEGVNPAELDAKLDFDWITVPAGTFQMGDPSESHAIQVIGFRIAKTPLTNAEYKYFVDATGHRQPQHWQNGQFPKGKEDHPVTSVSWDDAQAFCRWAGVCLPTEVEWEKAASWEADRGKKRTYPWGDEEPSDKLCNFDNSIRGTTPVHAYPNGASPYGCLDMAGNVWEWCSSELRDYPYQADDGREDLTPHSRRVLRGGAFDFIHHHVRCAYRDAGAPVFMDVDVGFRVVRRETARED